MNPVNVSHSSYKWSFTAYDIAVTVSPDILFSFCNSSILIQLLHHKIYLLKVQFSVF